MPDSRPQGHLCDDNLAFQEHCMDETVDHDDDFAFMCTEIEIVETMDEAVPTDRKAAACLCTAVVLLLY